MSKILRNLNMNKRHCEYLLKPLEKIGALKSFLYDISSYHGVLAFKSSMLKRWPFFSSSSVMQSNILKSLIFEKSILWEGSRSFACILYIRHMYIHTYWKSPRFNIFKRKAKGIGIDLYLLIPYQYWFLGLMVTYNPFIVIALNCFS